MRWWWTLDGGDGRPTDVLVDADSDVTWGALTRALATSLGRRDDERAHDGRPLSVAAPPSGTIWGAPGPSAAAASSWLHVRGGALAGTSLPLPGDDVSLGRSPENDIVIPDRAVSRHHLVVRRVGDGRWTIHPHDRAVTTVDGRSIPPEGAPLEPGALLEIGGLVCTIGGPSPDQAPVPGATAPFVRRPRARTHRREHRITLPTATAAPGASAMPWIAVGVLLLAVGLAAALTGTPGVLVLGAAAPIAPRLTGSRLRRRRAAVAARAEADRRALTDTVAALEADERAAAWRRLPDPVAIRDLCRARGDHLWQRRAEDADALHVRLGLGDTEVPVVVIGAAGAAGARPAPPVTGPVPVAVDLRGAGALDVIGPRDDVAGLGRWCLLQLAAHRSPRDLRLVLLCPDHAGQRWQWTTWLPHLRAAGVDAPPLWVGTTAATRAARIAELRALVHARGQARTLEHRPWFAPDVVVLIDALDAIPGAGDVTDLLTDGPAVGVHLVRLLPDDESAPRPAPARLRFDPVGAAPALLLTPGDDARRILPDAVGIAVAEDCARALAPVVHVADGTDNGAATEDLDLGDLLGKDSLDPALLTRRWQQPPTYTAVLGTSPTDPVTVDLTGPSAYVLVTGPEPSADTALVAGLVTSLALTHSPDALRIIVIDPRRTLGPAVAGLPHVVRVVGDLDAVEADRGLVSLQSELERRRTSRAAPGVDAGMGEGQPHLLVVVDGADDLRARVPAFLDGITRIGRVGASCGIHVVLSGLAHSDDVPAAWREDRTRHIAVEPGGACVLHVVGHDRPLAFRRALPTVRVDAQADPDAVVTRAVALRWEQLGDPLPRSSITPDDAALRRLRPVVEATTAAAANLRLRRSAAPWLPPLPSRLTRTDLAAIAGEARPGVLVAGLIDVPERQSQQPLTLGLDRGAVVAVVGGRRSGRTSLLAALAGEAQRACPEGAACVWALDLSPHPPGGEATTWSQTVVRMGEAAVDDALARLEHALAGHAASEPGAAEHPVRRPLQAHTPTPRVLLVDGWDDAPVSTDGRDARGVIRRLLRLEAAATLTVVITGSPDLLRDPVAANATPWVLPLDDPDDWRRVGVPAGAARALRTPGRAFVRGRYAQITAPDLAVTHPGSPR